MQMQTFQFFGTLILKIRNVGRLDEKERLLQSETAQFELTEFVPLYSLYAVVPRFLKPSISQTILFL